MSKWISLLPALMLAKVCCMQADTVYQIDISKLEMAKQISAGPNFEQEFANGFLKKIEQSSKEETHLKEMKLGILALIYNNWQTCLATGKTYNWEFLHFVFLNIDELEKRGISPCCIYLVIDDKPENVGTELFDIIQFILRNRRIDIYLSKNNGNIGVEKGRIKLFDFARNYELPYFCILDSDDILSKYCLLVMYQAMLANPEVLVGLGEYALVAFLDRDRSEVDDYLKQQCDIDALSDFDIRTYPGGSYFTSAFWHTIDDTFLTRFILDDAQKGYFPDSNGFLPMIFKYKKNVELDITKETMMCWCSRWMETIENCLIIWPKSYGKNSYLYGYRNHHDSHSHDGDSESISKFLATCGYEPEFLLLRYIVSSVSNYYRGIDNVNSILSMLIIDGTLCIDFLKNCYDNFDFNKLPSDVLSSINDKQDFMIKFTKSILQLIEMLKDRRESVHAAEQKLAEILSEGSDNSELFENLSRLMSELSH